MEIKGFLRGEVIVDNLSTHSWIKNFVVVLLVEVQAKKHLSLSYKINVMYCQGLQIQVLLVVREDLYQIKFKTDYNNNSIASKRK